MKYKNLDVIKKKSIPMYNLIRNTKIEKYEMFDFIKKKNDVDIYFSGSKKVYISSVNNKEYESTLLVEAALSGNYDEIIVIGFGNYPFLNELLNKLDANVKLHVVEFKEVFDIIINNVSIKNLKLNKINDLSLIDEKMDLNWLLNRVFPKTNMKFKIFVLPQYERIFKKEIDELYSKISKIIAGKKSSIHTDRSYQKLWIYNSIINFKHVISTPNFIDLKKYDFSNSMALLVGAGPSLSFELERLKEISDNETCYIFAIGSAYKALVKHNIRIDAIFSYDPTELNEDVLSEYYEKEVDAPICFGSSIGFKAIRKVDYNKAFHMLTSQDYFGQYLIDGKQSDVISDAPTVAIIALQALAKLGFGNITFVGQNMAYLNEKNYADGIYYERLKGKIYKTSLTVKDVFGNEVSTMAGYISTRDLMQQLIKITPNIKYINTTYGGAAVDGAEYIPLKEIDLEVFEKNVNLLEECPENDYVLSDVKDRFYDLIEDRKKFLSLLSDGLLQIYKVKEMLDGESNFGLELLQNLENTYNDICKTMYFKVLISKLDRSYLNMFESSIVEINRQQNVKKKYEVVYSKMGTLFSLFKKEDKKVFDLLQYISKYIKWEEV